MESTEKVQVLLLHLADYAEENYTDADLRELFDNMGAADMLPENCSFEDVKAITDHARFGYENLGRDFNATKYFLQTRYAGFFRN
jgi:hypothetical protein